MPTRASLRFSALILLLLLIFAVGGRAAPAQAQSTPVPLTLTGDQAAKFQQIHMIDATNGWAVVGIPNPHPDPYGPPDRVYAGSFAHLLRTQDGGQTWIDVSPPTPYGDAATMHYLPCDCFDNGLLKFVFLDDQHAWIANDMFGIPGNQIYNGISVWATSDGGESWQLSHVLDAITVLQMDFLDAQHGWLMLGGQPQATYYLEPPSTLYQTTDGGLHWQPIADDGVNQHYNPLTDPISDPETGIIDAKHTGMVFDTPDSGWITWSPFDPSYGTLRHSTDGGVTWHNVDMADDPHLPGQYNGCLLVNPQAFAPGSVAFLALCWDYDNGVRQSWFYHSDDAGATWQSTALPDGIPLMGELNRVPQVLLLDAATAWVVQCELVDYGSACGPATPPSLAQTRDGGLTWTTLAPLLPELGMLFDVAGGQRFSFIDADQGWAITQSGGLMTTSDGGATWAALTPEVAPR